ncbi:MAG: cation:proton antiporter [Acidobacteria bacterium]|nr:cation:proton antiporter [Acidobacteriota bacterium]
MIRLTALLAVLIALTWVVFAVGVPSGHASRAQETMILGFAILAAHTLGLLVRPLGLPMITGHLCLGLLVGSHGIGLITKQAVQELRLIDDIALALIALTAGGELVLGRIRPLLRSILSISLAQVILVFAFMAVFFSLLTDWVPFAQGLPGREILALCLLVGIVSVANSPATTIAVITETRAAGRFTNTVLGVTVIKDVMVILTFAVIFSLGEILIDPSAQFALGQLQVISLRLLVSVAAGFALAAGLAPLLSRVGRQLPVLIAGTAIAVAAFARMIQLDPLILCIAMGFAVRNFTGRGRELIRGIENVSPMIYAVFFTMAGAGLDLGSLARMWPIAVALVLARSALMHASTWFGSRLVEDQPAVRRWGWMGFVAQAGVTLGFASLVAGRFERWGADFKTLVVAVIAVNQIVGPILFKLALIRTHETGRREDLRPAVAAPPPARPPGAEASPPATAQASD